MGFKGSMRRRMLSQLTPSETNIGQQLAHILTTTEFELFQAVDRLVEAADPVDGRFVVPEDLETRRDRILAVADALAAQEFEAWWWDEYADEFIDNAERARDLAGISKQEWRDVMATLAERERARQPADHDVQDETDAQVAARRVEELFGVDLATFSAEVVEWKAAEHVDEIIRQNLRLSTRTIHQVASALEADDVQAAGDDTPEQ